MRPLENLSPCRYLTTAAAIVLAIFGTIPSQLSAELAEDQANSATAPDGDQQDSLQDADAAGMRGIKIRVLDPDGEPIQGVRVFRNHIYRTIDGRQIVENKDYFTDGEGRITIALSGISVDLRVWAIKENFVPLHAMWAKRSQSDGDRIPLEFTFQLQRGTEIGGVVTDENGEPIKGVKVEVRDRTAMVFHQVDKNRPGIRPVRSYWLTGDEGVLTDANGHWKIGNVPPDQVLVFRDPYENDPGPKIALRLSHPDYAETKDWGRLQRKQAVTLKSLRDETATIVLKQPEIAR